MSDAWKLRVLRWTYVAFIVQASADTALAGLHGSHEGAHAPQLLALAVPEIAAALAFLIEPIERYAAGILVAVYAAAAVLSVVSGDWPLRFFYYAATALFIVTASRKATSPLRAIS